MKTLLTIAGFDPSSGAGVTADLLVFAAHGHFGTSAITSLTVQSTKGVRASQAVSASLLRETLDCLEDDLPPDGIKIGMLVSDALVDVVAAYIEGLVSSRPAPVVVLDPVLRSTSGKELLTAAGLERLRSRLLPLVSWVTPNLSELAVLTGRTVERREDMEQAAQDLQARLPQLSVLTTGGHIDPPDDLVLPAGALSSHWLAGERIVSKSTHGTGCALSSALVSQLVDGVPPVEAALNAKLYVRDAIRLATPLGHGYGPLNHLGSLRTTR